MSGRGRPFTRGAPRPANAGRKPGAKNKRTLAGAPKTYPDALEHLARTMTATMDSDPTITPDLKLRAALGLAAYQNPKPTPLRFVGPVDYAAPKTVDEARAALLELGERLARREIPIELHDALVNGIRVWLADHTVEQERRLSKLEDALRSGSS